MIRLVWKDLVVSRWYLLALVLVFIFNLGAAVSLGPMFLMMTSVFCGFLCFGGLIFEARFDTDSLWCSLPLTRGDLVAARYLSAGIGIMMGLGISWTTGWLSARLVLAPESAAPPHLGFIGFSAVFVWLAFIAALYLPLYFRYGAGRSLMVFSAVAVGLLIALSLAGQLALWLAGQANPLLDPASWRETDPELRAKAAAWIRQWGRHVMIALVAIATCALFLSALISQRIYRVRDL